MEKQDVSRQEQTKVEEAQNEPEYGENGVDLSLIRWMLSLSPTERLHQLQSSINSLAILRGSVRAKN